jgi:hypothetical protein
MNIAQIEESLRELVETPFDKAVFIYRLLEIYGAPKATVTKLRQANSSEGSASEIIVKKKLIFRVSAKGKASNAVDEMGNDAKFLKAAKNYYKLHYERLNPHSIAVALIYYIFSGGD